MSARKRVLGRGLDALLGSEVKLAVAPEDRHAVRMMPFVRLRANPYQPRRHFSEEAIEELCASIRANGILQPLIVRKAQGEGYEIVAGERRWRAAQRAELAEVPVIVRDFTDQEMLELSLLENIQREDLNAIEEALAFQQLIEEFELTQEQVAERMGKSRVAVTNTLRLLRLPKIIQQWVVEERLTAGHARCLLSLEHESAQLALARETMNKKLSVRETERKARRLSKTDPGPPGTGGDGEGNGAGASARHDLEEKLAAHLGLKVNIHALSNTQGRVEIYYASLDEFQAILDRLGISIEQEI